VHLSSVDEITTQYRNIYLQPHFDDAALSCGGTLALQSSVGVRPLVVTIFGGLPIATQLSPFATQTLTQMGLGADPRQAIEQRREEDAAALESLGADTLWLDFQDAIFRGTPAFYQANESLFGSVHSGDVDLDAQLAAAVQRIHERAPLANLYAPLGVGHHVDHQLCCSAADRLAQQKVLVRFYEDFPYVTQPGALTQRQQELRLPMEPELVEISGQIRGKEEAIALYRSQVPVLFQSEDAMRKAVREYSSALRTAYPGIRIERYWRW
jgi:LmbE family N-acetylglucosaminyl deacetylase